MKYPLKVHLSPIGFQWLTGPFYAVAEDYTYTLCLTKKKTLKII